MPASSTAKRRKIKTLEHVRQLVAHAARQLEQGLIEPKKAAAIGYLGRVLMEIIRAANEDAYATRIAELEAMLQPENVEPPVPPESPCH